MRDVTDVTRWMRVRKFAVGVLALLGLLLVVVSLTPLTRWWAQALAGPWEAPQGEVLIVLGGAAPTTDGILADSTYLRSVYAVRTYRRQNFKTVVLSGGGTPMPVAASMQQFLVFQGVPASVIRIETSSTSTRENALYTKQLLDTVAGPKVLLTSDYHMFRAKRAFRKGGMEVLPHPIPDGYKRAGRWQTRWAAFLDLLTETAKVGYYFARGWI